MLVQGFQGDDAAKGMGDDDGRSVLVQEAEDPIADALIEGTSVIEFRSGQIAGHLSEVTRHDPAARPLASAPDSGQGQQGGADVHQAPAQLSAALRLPAGGCQLRVCVS